jgi:hypothetical protein
MINNVDAIQCVLRTWYMTVTTKSTSLMRSITIFLHYLRDLDGRRRVARCRDRLLACVKFSSLFEI